MKLTTKDFIERSIKSHTIKYDYSKVNYTKGSDKVTIICPKHGEFQQVARTHMDGSNCPECAKELLHKRFACTTDEFIEKAKKVHGDKYDYSKVNYNKNFEKVCIICPEHGEFWQTPNDHLDNHGCPKCKDKKTSERLRLTRDKFITKANIVHNNFYNYDKVVYNRNNEKVIITCPIHGDFEMTPNGHLNGQGCPKCYHDSKFLTTEEFIKKANKIHDNKYDYSLVNYKDSKSPVTIICPIHGEFKQTPNVHLSDHGCPKCSTSKGEKFIIELFNNNNIKYTYQFRLTTDKIARNSNTLYVDFYVNRNDKEYFIEYNGEQHYKPIEMFGGKIEYEKQVRRDKILEDYCNLPDSKIQLIKIKYDMKKDDIEKTLRQILEF